MTDLSTAAASMNVPEELVMRSATARASASDSSVDEILAAWAGGGSAPAPSSTAAPETVVAEETSVPPTPPEPALATEPAVSAVANEPVQPVMVATAPSTPPVLEGRHEQPFLYMLGAASLLVVALIVGFLAPALAREGNGVYTSAVPHTQEGLDGRDVYRSEGCGACHTQQVRPIVADAGLGSVTSPDTNQILGMRRYGPDLSHVGSRYSSPSGLLTVLTNSSDHASYAGLSDADLTNLTAYLYESK